jgi:hypothetical protein
MIRRAVLLAAAVIALTFNAAAQESVTPLIPVDVEVVERIGMFDQPVQIVEGLIRNDGDRAYGGISLFAEAYDDADALIGEGFGVLTNACGAGLLDAVIFPGESARFSAPLELFESDAEIDRVEIAVSAVPSDVDFTPPDDLVPGLRTIFAGEAVMVEFWREEGMLFASGCLRDPFYEWTWYRVHPNQSGYTQIEHPRADRIDPDLLQRRLLLRDELAWENAFIRFAPDGLRFIYQDHVNTMYTAAVGGAAIRALHGRLNSYTLQGIYWLPQGRFLAYHYGAFGDQVIYFTADVDGRLISPSPLQNPPSEIVPGVSTDGRRVVIAGDFEDGRGYYLYVVTNGFFEKLFEVEPPGNNYPAPLLLTDVEENLVRRVYFAQRVEDQARLTCFNRDTGELLDMGALPIRLAEDERGWMWVTPEEDQIILAANGQHGGVWSIQRSALPPC